MGRKKWTEEQKRKEGGWIMMRIEKVMLFVVLGVRTKHAGQRDDAAAGGGSREDGVRVDGTREGQRKVSECKGRWKRKKGRWRVM